MSDLLILTLCFGTGCLIWAGVARHGLSVLDRWRASDALSILLAVQVTRVAVRLGADSSPTALVALAAVVSALSFAGVIALRSDQSQARSIAWAAALLGGLDLVASFADAFVGGAAMHVAPVQVALSTLYMPALLVTQILLFRTLLRPEAARTPIAWLTRDSHLAATAFTPPPHSR